MGNCQAAEAVAIVIQHPSGGRVERAHGAVSAAAVMAANPGHYVAAVVPAALPSMASAPAAPAKRRLKLLRPDDTLVLGGVYRLVSFEGTQRYAIDTHFCPCFVSREDLVLTNHDKIMDQWWSYVQRC